MKKLIAFATAFLIATGSSAGLTDLYNTAETNIKASSVQAEQTSEELKNQLNAQAGQVGAMGTIFTESIVAKQEALKEQLATLVAAGEGETQKAKDMQAEIDAMQRMIETGHR